MTKFSEIVKEVIKICKDNGMVDVSPNVVLECSTKIYLSKSDSQQINPSGWKNSNGDGNNADKDIPTQKQIDFMQKNKIKYPKDITFNEAVKIIGEFIENRSLL